MIQSFPGRCAGEYRFVRQISSGGFGVVCLAEQIALSRPVAVKLLQPHLLDDRDLVLRFRDEARITASLSHPNIVTLIDHDVEEGIPWIAFEYLPGPTLADLVQEGPLPPRRALEAARQVAAALEAAHGAGILHRDIKPANVIETGRDTYKVTDFGVAKWLAESISRTRTGQVVGTRGYLAPEIYAGVVASEKSDLFALGVLLFTLLKGRGPAPDATVFPGIGPGGPGRLFDGMEPTVAAVLEGLLASDADERFESAAQVRQVLDTEVATTPDAPSSRDRPGATGAGRARPRRRLVQAVPGPAGAARSPRTRPWLVAGMLGIGLAAAIGAAAWTREQSASSQESRPVRRSPSSTPGPFPVADLDARLAKLFLDTWAAAADYHKIQESLTTMGASIAEGLRTAKQQHAFWSRTLAEAGEVFLTLAPSRRGEGQVTSDLACIQARAAFYEASARLKLSWIGQARALLEDIERTQGEIQIDFTENARRLHSIAYEAPVLRPVQSWMLATVAALRAAAEDPVRAGDRTGHVLSSVWEISRHFALLGWSGKAQREFEVNLVKPFERDLQALEGAMGEHLGQTALDLWRIGQAQKNRGPDQLRLLENDLSLLTWSLPASRRSLERLKNLVASTLSGPPGARPSSRR